MEQGGRSGGARAGRRNTPPRPKRDPDAEIALTPVSPLVDAWIDSQLDPDEPPYETRPRFSRGDPVPALGNGVRAAAVPIAANDTMGR